MWPVCGRAFERCTRPVVEGHIYLNQSFWARISERPSSFDLHLLDERHRTSQPRLTPTAQLPRFREVAQRIE